VRPHRRSTRREARRSRQAAFWSDRMASARTQAEKAAVSWDQLRARITALAAGEQDPVWAALVVHLGRFSPETPAAATGSEVHTASFTAEFTPPRGPHTDARSRAREPHALAGDA
jgi:hypothetical protein